MDSSSSVIPFSQNAKLKLEETRLKAKISARVRAHFTIFFRMERKYRMLITASTPEKIRKVTAVPTEGIVTKVGRKVPIMLPTVFSAPSSPTVFPLLSRLLTEYFTREGVTVPSSTQGKANTPRQAQLGAAVNAKGL